MTRTKFALVGSGQIGGTLANLICLKRLGDIALIDIAGDMAKGKGLDLLQAAAISGVKLSLSGGDDWSSLKDADVVIVTSGIPRKPGMDRGELLSINGNVICQVAEGISKYCPGAFVITITNPLDAMVWLMQKASKLPHARVVGMAGVLDTARFRAFLADELNCAPQDIHSLVLGGHGDAMVPLPRYTSIAGIPLTTYLEQGWISESQLNEIINRTRHGGGEIVNLLKSGSAFYAPAAAAIEMAESYILDQKRILPCAAYLSGEYGYQHIYAGVPVVIGKSGVEKIIELPLSEPEKQAFQQSMEGVQQLIDELNTSKG